MRESQLKSQIRKDGETVSKISVRARESYDRELKGTLDRGAFYRFTANT